MKYVPHDYQAYCIQRVVEDPAVGLFLRPGLGKTVITLSAVNILKYFRWQVQKVLVVAPKKVAEATWSKEAAKWDHLQHLRTSVVLGSATKRIKALNTPADIYVINRENVEWLVDYYKQAWPFDMVVLDESTSFKNSQSKRWKAMRRVRRFIKRMVLLTGTPSSKGLIDLWAQVYLLDCGERLGQSLSAYRERYFDPDQRSRTQIFSYKAKDGAESAVLNAISDICISMKAEDYLELPDFIQHEVPVLLDAKARRAYDQFERDLLLEVDEDVITAASAAVLVGKLLQMCNGAVYSNDGHIVPVHDCKLEAYLELLEQLNGEHCLTFYGYQHDRDRILEALKKHRKDLRVRVYKTVEDEEAWNNGEVDVLLVHPASCAYGLNLQQGGGAQGRRDGPVRLVRRVSVVEFRECAHSVNAEVLVEAFGQPLCLVPEGRALHLEADVHVRFEQERPRTALMIGEVPFGLRSLVNSPVLDIPRGEGPYAPAGDELVVHHPDDAPVILLGNR